MGRRASSRARRDSRRSATNEATRRLLDKQRRARARCRALRNANRRENVESDSVVSSRQPPASRRRAGGAGRGRARCASRNRSERRREEREVDVRRTWRRVCASLWPMSNLGRAFLTWQRKNLVFGVTRHTRFVWAISLTALSDEKPRATESALEPAERFGDDASRLVAFESRSNAGARPSNSPAPGRRDRWHGGR